MDKHQIQLAVRHEQLRLELEELQFMLQDSKNDVKACKKQIRKNKAEIEALGGVFDSDGIIVSFKGE